jgi:hypothetical protein
VYRILVGAVVRKWLLGTLTRKLEDNIKMDLSKIVCGVERWMKLAQDHVQWWVWYQW